MKEPSSSPPALNTPAITNGNNWLPWFNRVVATRFGNLVIWVTVLAAGLILLTGRYAWKTYPEPSKIGYFCSAYYFLVVTPVIYYLTYYLSSRRSMAIIVTGIWWVVATLPYIWLGLDRFYYSLESLAPISKIKPPKEYDWFPHAFESFHAVPYEAWIFFSLILLGLGVVVFLHWRYPKHRKYIWLGLLAYFAIVMQTWMHLSLRSPYVYITSYERELGNWYVRYMFSNKMGAVNADLNAFRAVEVLFMGKLREPVMFFRRSFYFYITSQISYFINLYYVGLLLNIALWTAATLCAYSFTRKYWSERVALLTAGFIATGSGFIMFVAQPLNYLAQYASIMIIAYLFEKLVAESRAEPGKTILFALILGLASLTYDFFPFYIFIAGYGLLRNVGWKSLLATFVISLAIYSGLILLYTRGLGAEIPNTNSVYISEATSGLIELLRSGSLRQWYAITRNFFGLFFLNMGSAFFILPTVFALLGLPLLKERKPTLIILLFFLPGIALQAFLQYGNTWIYQLPRLYYIVYPGIYILAAVFLDHIGQILTMPRLSRLAPIIPWLGLASVIILNNVDVWGFPVAYFHFYWSTPSPPRLIE